MRRTKRAKEDDDDDYSIIHLAVLGDSKCGKTSLVKRYVNDTFYDEYLPTTMDSNKSVKDITINDLTFRLFIAGLLFL